MSEWRWEFLRRDPEYIKDWQDYRSWGRNFELALKGDPEDDCYGFGLPYYPEEFEDCWDDVWRIFRKYGLARLLDPSISRPKHLWFHFVPFRADLKDIPELRTSRIQRIPWKLQHPYLAWFELWNPIEPQIAFMTDVLKREQLFALQALAKLLPEGAGRQNKTLKNWVPPEMEVLMRKPGERLKKRRSSIYPSAIRNRKLDPTDWPKHLRVWDAVNAGVSPKDIGVKVLGFPEGDYSKAISNAQAVYEAAQGMWRKIRAERIEAPAVGREEALYEDSHNVIPPIRKGSPRLDDWLTCLHPRLHKLLLTSLV